MTEEKKTEEKKTAKEAAKEWLTKSGYPLEFRVAEQFRDANMLVTTQHYLDDPATGKRREVDVVAELARALPIVHPLGEGEVGALEQPSSSRP